MINLNDASFDAKSNDVVIFNNGDAGLVENVSLTVAKRKPEDKENSPEYKLTFSDANGGSCNTSFWYVDKATAYATVDEQVVKQGKILKHVIHAIYGADYQLPSFQDAKGMLDGCMKLIREGASNGKFRVFANYGTPEYPKQYIQPRSWVPFMESMSVSLADTRLVAGKNDNLVRISPDSGETATAKADAIIEGDEW